jgi:hypothetical protein
MFALLFLKVPETGIKVLLGSTKVPPEYVIFAFTMLTNIVEHLCKEIRHVAGIPRLILRFLFFRFLFARGNRTSRNISRIKRISLLVFKGYG